MATAGSAAGRRDRRKFVGQDIGGRLARRCFQWLDSNIGWPGPCRDLYAALRLRANPSAGKERTICILYFWCRQPDFRISTITP